MADRRKAQNYCSLPHYLTDEQWSSFSKQTKEKTEAQLLCHLWELGLRCPTESTYAVVFNLLQLTCPNDGREKTSFQKYEALQALKRTWKKYKTVRRHDDFKYHEYVETLPSSVQDLPAEYYILGGLQSRHACTTSCHGSCLSATCEYINVYVNIVWLL